MTRPIAATAIRFPRRETVEFTPEAMPANSEGADLSAVDVIGATSIARPREKTMIEAKPHVQKSLLSVTGRISRMPMPTRKGPTVR